jgi:hypothetical protein
VPVWEGERQGKGGEAGVIYRDTYTVFQIICHEALRVEPNQLSPTRWSIAKNALAVIYFSSCVRCCNTFAKLYGTYAKICLKKVAFLAHLR